MILSEEILQLASLQVTEMLGLNFPSSRWKEMERGLLAAAGEAGIGNSKEKIAEWISKADYSRNEADIIINCLTVGETYFFREKDALEIFSREIIHEFKQNNSKKSLRIWSAGCCTGEEPYTLAIILRELIPGVDSRNVSILATDLNPAFLQKAREGKYSNWSFRDIPPNIKYKYFRQEGKYWVIADEIKKMVQFERLNLATHPFPSKFPDTRNVDVIFCRNVLMYLTPDVIRLVGNSFYKSLNEAGWFITSPVELNDDYFADFKRVQYNAGIVYRKLPLAAASPEKKPDNFNFNLRERDFVKSKKRVVIIQKNQNNDSIVQPIAFNPLSDIELASMFYERADYDGCSDFCQKILLSNPTDIDALTMITKAQADLGSYFQAENWAKKLIAADSLVAESYYLFASVLYELGDFEMAVKILKQGLYLNQSHRLMHLLIGNAYLKLNNENMAAKHLKNAELLLFQPNDNVIMGNSKGITSLLLNEVSQKQ